MEDSQRELREELEQYVFEEHANEIVDGLWLGDVVSSYCRHQMRRLGITHVLTIAKGVPAAFPKDFTYKVIAVHDIESVDLLDYFNECSRFIHESRLKRIQDNNGNNNAIVEPKIGGILVHCMAGMSRSATLVLAYIMEYHQISFTEAVELVRLKRPIIEPNSGFVAQLKRFESLGCRVNGSLDDLSYKKYKIRTQLKKLEQQWEVDGMCEVDDMAVDPHLDINLQKPNDVYVCLSCKRHLFHTNNIVHFNVSSSGSVHYNDNNNNANCKTIYIEPIVWMKDQLFAISGAIECECKKKIGEYFWKGGAKSECSCGESINPAFKIYPTRVKIKSKRH